MHDDCELLRRFVEDGAESDFAELVRRHAPLVYHAALRRTGGRADLAEEVCQYVFTALAQNARKLVGHTALVGWLFTTTRLGVLRILREERRRREREQKLAAMTELHQPDAQAQWERVRPDIDGLLDQLSESDRTAVLLRYLQGHSLAEVGSALGLSPDSARKRIDRAVERLRSILIKRGFLTSSAVLSELLANEASGAAPAQLVQRLTGVALKQTLPAASSATLAVGGSTLALSGAAVFGWALVTVGGAAGLVGWSVHEVRIARTEREAWVKTVQASEHELATLKVPPAAAANSAPVAGDATNASSAARARSDRSNSVSDKEAIDARANGARFLATVPRAREQISSFEQTQLRAVFAGFYRAAHLTPAEIDLFQRRVADFHLDAVELSHNRMVTTAGDLPVDAVRALFGEERARIYERYLPELPARGLALEAAATINYSSPAASPVQVDQLTRLLVEANPSFAAGSKFNLENEDWSAAMPKLKALFSAEQWSAVEGLFLGHAYRQALHQAQTAAMATMASSTAATTP